MSVSVPGWTGIEHPEADAFGHSEHRPRGGKPPPWTKIARVPLDCFSDAVANADTGFLQPIVRGDSRLGPSEGGKKKSAGGGDGDGAGVVGDVPLRQGGRKNKMPG